MKAIIIVAACLITFTVKAQSSITPTDLLSVTGKVKQIKTFTLAALDTFATTKIKEQLIYNRKKDAIDTIKNMEGVLVKTILSQTEFVYSNSQALNEFYFVFTGSDGYRVVFSWNEIYNTEVGNNFYLITKMNGDKIKDMSQRIMVISTADIKNKRRSIKWVKSIEVKQID